ncbi:MAG: phage holin family protein [Usitatibacter sp.]
MIAKPSGMPVVGGLFDALRAAGRTLNEIAQVRGSLFAVELREEIARRGRMLVLAAIGFAFLHTALLLVTLLALVVFWDSHRILAIALTTAAYIGCGAAAIARLRFEIDACPEPFTATRAEFAQDLAELRRSP